MLKIVTRYFVLIACIWFAGSVAATQSFSNMYVFGDSLSDTGNLASVIGDFPAPYVDNRVSNGPIAVDVMADKLHLSVDASLYLLGMVAGTNYAVATARAGGEEVIDLNAQIASYLAAHNYSADSDALYVIFIGGNDVRDARELVDAEEIDAVLGKAVTAIKTGIENLVTAGARNIITVNSPDIGAIPETLILAQLLDIPELPQQAKDRSKQFNKLLRRAIQDIEEESDMEIASFDLFKFLTKVIRKAKKYGFVYTSEPCFYRETLTFHPACNFGESANDFLFFDEIHPTTKGHRLVGDAMLKTLRKSEKEDKERRRSQRNK